MDPFLDEKGILQVGRRIRKFILDYELKHPVPQPREGHITSVIMRYYNDKVAYAGRRITINELRSQGNWTINCTSTAKSIISKCADLLSDRLTQEPPFTYCGINMYSFLPPPKIRGGF